MEHLTETGHEITGIKRMEGILRENEERFRLISETLPIGVFEVNCEGQCLYTNTRWQEIFGMTLAESLTTELSQWFHPEEREAIWEEWSAAMDQFSGFSKECRILTQKGEVRWIYLRSAPVFHDAGIRYTGTAEEITKRKQAEEALRRSEETARQMAQENAVMAEIGRIINSTLNIDEVYERFAEEVKKLIPFDRIVINTINIENDTVINVYISGKGVLDRETGKTYSLKGSGNAEMVRTKSTLLIQTEDFNESEERFPMLLSTFQAGFRSILNVPLFSKGKIIGGLLLRSFKPYAYTDKEVRLAERIGDLIAGAIANAQLFLERQKAEGALRVSEDRYRDLVEHSQDLICIHDLEGRTHSVNEAGAKLLGYEKNELLKINFRDMLAPKVKDQFERYIAELKRDGFSKGFMLVRTKNGENRIWEYNSSLRTEGISTPLVRGMAHDITERKRAEKALQKSREELLTQHEELNRLYKEMEIVKEEWETTMNCLGDMVLLTNSEGQVKRCNQVFKDFVKRTDAEILTQNWEDLLHRHQIITNKFYEKGIEAFHKPTGRWFILSSYPYQDGKGGKVIGSVIAIHDTTELKRIAETLETRNREIEENRMKLQQALDHISSLIRKVMKEKGFHPDSTNPYLKKCYETLNCDNRDCRCFGKEALKCWEIVGMYCKSKIQWALEKKCNNCNTCPVYLRSTSDPIYQIGEQFTKMMHLLEAKNGELKNAYRELKETQTKILQQEKMASIGQLAAGVAHEINNPMAFISSNLGTLGKYVDRLNEFIQTQSEAIASLESAEMKESVRVKKEALKLDFILEDIKELVKESLEGTDRVRKIVQGLKAFARVDEADNKNTDINECIESTINIVWNELKYKAILKRDFGDIPLTKCFPQQLNQVVMNILTNAVHSIEKQGEIAVKTWSKEGFIYIAISDTGCGIPKENLHRIFEPFFTTKEVGKGTGLGLSIAYEIVKKHKGEITVQSEVGRGTTFIVEIPIVVEG